MFQALNDVLNGQEQNYMMPFFWMRDNHHDALRDRVRRVYRSGCRALCVESRTHEDFCGKTWWEDMDAIFDECEKLGMQVWILDDKHFPTGMANDIIKEKYPERRKWHLREYHVDVYGPMTGASLYMRESYKEDELLGVYAYKRTGNDEEISKDFIDLTDKAVGGRVRFDIPEGYWRVFFYYKTRKGIKRPQENYIHYIDPESVSALIEAVYEPHYERYQKYFGNVLQGFFSDEPQFGNTYLDWHGDIALEYSRTLGLPGTTLPVSDRLLENMSKDLGKNAVSALSALWYDVENNESARVRYAYMDNLTRLWQEAFSYQLGDWCEKRNVLYIGHIIEDNNAHARLAYSAGHFFRALDGQHMAGIDVVLHQIIPGMHEMKHTYSCSGGMTDPAFFDYILAKLASSHAHIQKRKAGRAMCEVFGAYGWAEGAPMMKQLMDHMLVRGINHYVPHAYSPDYPDTDCPPHFGLYEIDPQAEGFDAIMRYSNRVCHLLYPGVHRADAAILYHAEAEWTGKEMMLMQTPAKLLYTNQIDFDIVPADALKEAETENGRLKINLETYKALIVPGASCLPENVRACLISLKDKGIPVIFIGFKPENMAEFECVSEADFIERVKEYAEVGIAPAFKDISLYRTVREDGSTVVMAVNENMLYSYDGKLTVPYTGDCLRLDLLYGKTHRVPYENGVLPLTLAPGQSAVFVFGENLPEAPYLPGKGQIIPFTPEWEIETREADGENKPFAKTKTLPDITESDEYASFAGFVRYKANLNTDAPENIREINLGEVGMTAKLSVNGEDLGIRISKPYCFDLTGKLKKGDNEIEIVVGNSLAGKVRDYFTTFLQVPSTGLMGPVELTKNN